MKHKKPFIENIPKYVMNLVFIIISALCIYPVVWMILGSLRTERDYNQNPASFPQDFSAIQNYMDAIDKTDLPTAFLNSVIVTFFAILFIIIFSVILGYFFARFDFRGKRFLYMMYMLGLMIPVYGFLTPLYTLFNALELTNHWYTLIIPNVAFQMSLGLILVQNFIKGVPFEIEEAAVIDGASLNRRLLIIILPMCKPVMATLIILSFIYVWNEFAFAYMLVDLPDLKTVPLAVAAAEGERTVNYTMRFAVLVLSSIPVIAVYSVFNKSIVKGMVAGAVKG